MKIVYIGNFKGGGGKTTIAASLAYVLTQEYKKRVLLIDADPQGNLTNAIAPIDYIHAYNNGEPVPDTCDLFQNIGNDEKLEDFYIKTDFDGLKLIPTWKYVLTPVLNNVAKEPAKEFMFQFFINQFREELEEKFDYIILDTPPHQDSLITLNALIISDVRIGILDNDKDSITALYELSKTFVHLQKATRVYKNTGQTDIEYCLDAIIINKVEDVSNFTSDFLSYVESIKDFSDIIQKPYIHYAVAIKEIKLKLSSSIKRNKRSWNELTLVTKEMLKKGVL
jgi:chromosome partitioning protein